MTGYQIALIPGDGIGPELTETTLKGSGSRSKQV